jgi:hypothetical protein
MREKTSRAEHVAAEQVGCAGVGVDRAGQLVLHGADLDEGSKTATQSAISAVSSQKSTMAEADHADAAVEDAGRRAEAAAPGEADAPMISAMPTRPAGTAGRP